MAVWRGSGSSVAEADVSGGFACCVSASSFGRGSEVGYRPAQNPSRFSSACSAWLTKSWMVLGSALLI